MFGVSRGAFPSATTQPFGSTGSSFGTQQQQQPVANSSTFALGQQANTTQAPAFGNFGNQTSKSPFGMSGSTAANGTPFGQAQLGSNNNASGSIFGGMGNNTSLSASSTSVAPNSTAGTSIKPFTTFEEKDPTTGVTNVFQSITCMPEYRNFSFEELRFQDYQAGRKFGTGQNGAGTTFSNPQGTTNAGFGMMGNNNSNTSATTGGLFGQKPAAGMFGGGSGGGFGPGASNTTGLFGSSTNLSGNSAFGANKPAAPGGLFGNTTNSTNNTNSTGLFGQQNSNTNANLFGQQPNSFGANNMTGGGAFGQVNRGAFSQQQPQQSTGGIFGQANANANGGAFGQQQNTGGLFGAKPASGGLFGQTSGTNAFGMNNNTSGVTSTGLFGQNNQQQSGAGLLGQQQSSTAGGLFGQNNQNQNQSGLFGQQNSSSTFGQSQQQGGLFGSKPTGGLFGQQQGASTFGSQGNSLFGQSNQPQQSTGGLFGQSNNQSQPQTGGLFGQSNQTNNQPFGQNGLQQPQQNTNLFGAKPGGLGNTGLFSNSATNPNNGITGNNLQQQSGGLFQNKQQPASGSLFGPKPGNSVAGGLFGNNQAANQNNTTSTTGGLFGNKPTTGSLFGGANGTASNTTSGGLFGSNNVSSTAATTTSTGLFGNKSVSAGAPTTGGGLFGNNNTSSLNNGIVSTGLFNNNNNSQPTNGGGLFQNNTNTNISGGGLFPQSQSMAQSQNVLQQQQQQQRLQLQNSNPYGTNELFSKATVVNTASIPVQPSATKIKADERKKASLSSAYKMVPKTLFTTKLKSKSTAMDKVQIKADPNLSISVDRKNNQITISSQQEETLDESILKASQLLFNPDKRSFKNLINNKKLLAASKEKNNGSLNNDNTTRSKIDEKGNTPENLKIDEKETENGGKINTLHSKSNEEEGLIEDHSIKVSEENKENITDWQKQAHLENDKKTISAEIAEQDASFINENYYISPSMDVLSSYSLLQLRKVSHLVVGHKNYGKIEFLESVDLAEIPLTSLGGIIITFEPKTCIIYANSPNKPKRGEGINVRARITCFNCYPVDKSTRKPIKDPNHQLVKRHIERLKNNPNSKFESYDATSGTYVFIVNHAAEQTF
ncbi:hypothetical protein SMKI_13G1730 [Saccharomyces mikatae IFO 1815]|uniref:Peptidase S59 domain-containing protein n=1 Tax=Saccharomyces mikatae IFO 1815 TaxID=226126 RepID=A0AA35ITC2_SACMI|nr:uncharacterized protein SMKI_13G1730 [Saccharomyces mikatae IFO 1815]CAI4035524.1 hypothetical protein SMKI_13G1730 [Saccharomyces mikatae IFO 1815]